MDDDDDNDDEEGGDAVLEEDGENEVEDVAGCVFLFCLLQFVSLVLRERSDFKARFPSL